MAPTLFQIRRTKIENQWHPATRSNDHLCIRSSVNWEVGAVDDISGKKSKKNEFFLFFFFFLTRKKRIRDISITGLSFFNFEGYRTKKIIMVFTYEQEDLSL